jgi:hypothetical protein
MIIRSKNEIESWLVQIGAESDAEIPDMWWLNNICFKLVFLKTTGRWEIDILSDFK